MPKNELESALNAVQQFLDTFDLGYNQGLKGSRCLSSKFWMYDEYVYRISFEHEYVHVFYNLGLSLGEEEEVTEIQDSILRDGAVYAHGPLKGLTFSEGVELYGHYVENTPGSELHPYVKGLYAHIES